MLSRAEHKKLYNLGARLSFVGSVRLIAFSIQRTQNNSRHDPLCSVLTHTNNVPILDATEYPQ